MHRYIGDYANLSYTIATAILVHIYRIFRVIITVYSYIAIAIALGDDYSYS